METTVRYEVLILAAPEITQDEEKELEKQFSRVIATGNGSMISFERWGKYRLFYPIRKNDYGVYYLARFQAPPQQSLLQEIRTFFVIRFDTLVMRHLISALEDHVSLEYQRPRSLEEAPAREEGFGRGRRGDRESFSAVEQTEELDHEGDQEGEEQSERQV
jgi:small subunit ribosomal protein S6